MSKPGSALRAWASAVLLTLALSAPAWARDWRISNFHSDIVINSDGRAAVTERITLVFSGAFNGIYRTIPIRYPGPRGSNYTLFLSVESVTDSAGNPLKYESSREGDYRKLKIYIPGAVDTSKTVLIRYSSPNAVRYFDSHDEFYWNVTGNDWPVPIDAASATVALPASASGQLRAQAFTGVYGSVQRDTTWEVLASTVSFRAENPLPMRGGLTVDVYIPKGIVHQPGPLTRAVWFLRSNAVLLLPLWALLVMWTLWYFRGRDPDPGLSVAPMYEPPAKMTPAEAGTLLDDRIDPRDITSTLVDLAVRGYLKISEVEEPGIFFKSKDYVFHRIRPESDWNGLEPFERVILRQVFAGGEQTKLSSLKNRFYTAIPMIRQDVYAALKRKGMYWLDPESASAYTILGIILSAAPFVLLQITGAADLFLSPLLVAIAIAASVPIIWLFGRNMTAKSMAGSRTWVAVRGFQEFIHRVDADRLRRMPPDTFEKFLPYAMAFGLEQQWAQKFAGIIKDPPSWYIGPDTGHFNPVLFSNRMHVMASSAQSVFVSAPRGSSSGSGFSGGGGFSGGFSGGGFGGGGGGAF